jgi:2-dehydropantoate 2-reductase
VARVAIIGAGSIGGYFAGELVSGGHEVVLCVRTPFPRLVVDHLDGRRVEVVAPVLTDPAELEPADWVLLATKAHQTSAAAAWLGAACGAATHAVAVLQNGVDHEARVRPFVGDTPVLPAIVRCGAEAVAPGHVVHHGFSELEVPAGPLAADLSALFAGTDAGIVFTDDFVSAVWRKLVSNVTASPITALTTQRLGVMRRPEIQRLAIALAEECVRVANAAGATIPLDEARMSIENMAHTNPDMGSSMLYDRLAGRPLEHEALTGAVVRHGRAHGIDTPLNEVVYALLGAIGPG